MLDTSLDLSNFASYIRFAAERRQFGHEVVPMAGPYGFVVYGWVYAGDLFGTRIVLEFATKLALAALVLRFFQRTRFSVTGWLWLIANVLVLTTSAELTYDFAVLYSALFLLVERPRRWTAFSVLLLLALLSLGKGTQLILTLAVLATLSAELIWRRAWRDLVFMLGTYTACLLGLWTIAGQSLGGLPAYIRNIQEFSKGYVTAMALQESPRVFALGLTSLIVHVTGIGLLGLSRRARSVLLTAVVLFGGFTFLQWKHGFVRADGHVLLFFDYCLIGSFTLLAFARIVQTHSLATSARIAWCIAGAALAIYADGEHVWGRLSHRVTELPTKFTTSVSQIVSPKSAREALIHALERQRARFSLPDVVKKVGREPIAFFGIESGYLALNQLNEQPTPVAGGGPLGVFTPRLQSLNEQYVRSAELRPRFFLLKLESIDDHLVTQDDAGTLNTIVHSYRPVLVERGMILLEAAPAAPLPAMRLLSRQTFKPGEDIQVPAAGENEVVLASLDLPFSPAGLLRTALYKSGIVTLAATTAGSTEFVRRRIVPTVAATPFVVSPFIETTADLLELYAPSSGPALQVMRVESSPASTLSEQDCSISFYAQPRPKPLPSSTMAEFKRRLGYPIANRVPDSIESGNARLIAENGGLVQLLEPPGRIIFDLRGDERELSFDYGFMAEAYTRGTTDGADFIVELATPGSPPEQIYSTRRDPRAVAAHRSWDRAHLWLPVVKSGMQLQLRTAGGIHGAADWDWTYFDNIRIQSGPLRVEQFPGFSTTPSSIVGRSPRMFTYEGKDVLLLNAPGSLIFDLNGRERSVSFSAGLIAGAYQEGRTDGVEFIVELRSVDGALTPLFKRWLQPKSVEADRGMQKFDVNFENATPGSQLIVRTAAGPANDESWDWSYIANLRLN